MRLLLIRFCALQADAAFKQLNTILGEKEINEEQLGLLSKFITEYDNHDVFDLHKSRFDNQELIAALSKAIANPTPTVNETLLQI